MIRSLFVSGLALIDRLEIDLSDGLTVLSGETGAGKTMLIEALNLAVGQRADSGLVREGASEARVAVRWSDDGSAERFERRVSRDGRNRCLIDDKEVTAQTMSSAAAGLVDLHGQHDHQRLLHQRWHADYLDHHAGKAALAARQAYGSALDEARRATRMLADIDAAASDRETLKERLRREIDEIKEVGPSVEEAEDLDRRLPVLRHAQQLSEAVGLAYASLEATADPAGGSPGGVHDSSSALDGVREALAALEPVKEFDDRLDELTRRGESALLDLEDVSHALADYLADLDTDPGAYAKAEDRAAAIDKLKAEYGDSVHAVLEHLARAEETLDTVEGGDERRAEVEARLDEAMHSIVAEGEELTAQRTAAAPGFAHAVQKAARQLAMADARFVVDVRTADAPEGPQDLEELSADGADVVEFLFSANAGEAVRPLARVASGGELSRLMLAIKGVLGEADSASTVVFDEIDAGIGGETALAVAQALRRLGARRQVLVITHLPQIAAVADHNLVVEKSASGGRTVTGVREVEGEALETELARMLSGDSVSEASRKHAKELLKERASA